MYTLLESLANQNEAIAVELSELLKLKGTYPSIPCWSILDYREECFGTNDRAVEKHGLAYLKATKMAINVAEEMDMDVERPQVQLLLTRLVEAILDTTIEK